MLPFIANQPLNYKIAQRQLWVPEPEYQKPRHAQTAGGVTWIPGSLYNQPIVMIHVHILLSEKKTNLTFDHVLLFHCLP